MKLGLGELEQPYSAGYSNEFTQTRFLIILEKCSPQILLEARDDVYPFFRDLLVTIPSEQGDEFFNNLNTGWRYLENIPAARAFLERLMLWAKRWHLEADWCIERTIMAMRRYYGIKAILSEFSWFYPLETILVGDDGKKPFKDKIDRIFDYPVMEIMNSYTSHTLDLSSPPGKLPEFNPYLTWKEYYLLRIEEETRRRLENDPYLSIVEKSHREAYIKLVKECAAEYAEKVKAFAISQAGLRQVKTKPKLITHLEWTVRVWVLGENYSQVASSAAPKRDGKKPTLKAVKKAVKEILEIIELTWAAQLEERFPQGRPKKAGKNVPKTH